MTTTPNSPSSDPNEPHYEPSWQSPDPSSDPNGPNTVLGSTRSGDDAGEPRTPQHALGAEPETPPSPTKARIPHSSRIAILVAALALTGVALLGIAQLSVGQTVDSAQSGQETAEQKADNAEQQKQAVAGPLAEVCRRDPVIRAKLGSLCTTATSVQQAPPSAPRPPRDGRGIASTVIAGGHFLVTYSDGVTEDKGVVVGTDGHDGKPGKDAAPARSITGSSINSGDLILSYSDGTTEDVGRIVGPAGRSVASTAIVDGHLIVTYDDGSTQDAGLLPQARGIASSEVRDCHLIITYTDGSTQDAGDTCSTETVTPTTTTEPSTSDDGGLLPLPTG